MELGIGLRLGSEVVRVAEEARARLGAQPAALDDEAVEDVEGHVAHAALVAREHGVGRRVRVAHPSLLHAVEQRGRARAVAERGARRDGDAVVHNDRRELGRLCMVRVRA